MKYHRYGPILLCLPVLLLVATSSLRADLIEGVSSLSGEVYIDLDNNGIRAPWECPIEGVEIHLCFTAEDIVYQLAAWTGPNGIYRFDDLPV